MSAADRFAFGLAAATAIGVGLMGAALKPDRAVGARPKPLLDVAERPAGPPPVPRAARRAL
ncbi:MAG TPA: hypothetical protein VEI02_08615, partial [Planctomycetota bacterium]|nr:hypothetical protein [Planctomycetota bacterium]